LSSPRSYVPIDERCRPPLHLLGAGLDYWPRVTPRRPTSMPCGSEETPMVSLLPQTGSEHHGVRASRRRRVTAAGHLAPGTSGAMSTDNRAAAATSVWLAVAGGRLNSGAVRVTAGGLDPTNLSMAISDYLHRKRRASAAAEVDRRRGRIPAAHRVEPSADCPGISPAETCGCLVQSVHLDLAAGRGPGARRGSRLDPRRDLPGVESSSQAASGEDTAHPAGRVRRQPQGLRLVNPRPSDASPVHSCERIARSNAR
jgi:hypothetical protein